MEAICNCDYLLFILQPINEQTGGARVPDRNIALFEARAMEIARSQLGSTFQTGLMMYMFIG